MSRVAFWSRRESAKRDRERGRRRRSDGKRVKVAALNGKVENVLASKSQGGGETCSLFLETSSRNTLLLPLFPAAMSLSASATVRGRAFFVPSSTARPSCSASVGAGSNLNLAAADINVVARQTRRHRRRGELAISASLVGFNRPSPPWPSSMRGSSVRELDSGTFWTV